MIEDKKTIIITHVENISEGEKSSSEPTPDFTFVPVTEPYNHTQKKKKFSPRFFMLIALMILALGTGALIYTLTSRDAGASGVTGKSSDVSSASSPTLSSEPVSESTVSEVSDVFVPDISSASAESSETAELPLHDPLTPPEGYDYTVPAPKSAPQEDSWFDDAVFVGNSRTQGLMLYTGMGAKCYADVGLTVETVFTADRFTDPIPEPVSETDGEETAGQPAKITAAQALEKDTYRKVYLMFGINELGWSREDIFISKYASLIDTILSSHPDAQVYVQSILPVSADKHQETSYLTNERIAQFNGQLQQLAAEKEVFYLDVSAAFRDENGALPEDLSNDGVHLKKDGCITWKEYLLSHTVTTAAAEADAEGASSDLKYAAIQIPSVSESN